MSGCSTSDSLAGMGLSSTYQTVCNRTKEILMKHNASVAAYINNKPNAREGHPLFPKKINS